MTKTKILNSILEQMTDQYRLRAHYLNKGETKMAKAAKHRMWSIYWCGLELLGDGYHDTLDELRQNARESGERFADMLEHMA